MARLVALLDGENSKAIPIFAVLAIVFHILVIIIVPYILSMQWKPKILSRPPTFELVKIQTPQPPARTQPAPPQPVVETPAEPIKPVEPQKVAQTPPKPSVEKKVEPKKEETPKPVEQTQTQPKQVVEEDISDLEDMFAEAPSAPASQSVSLQISEPFPYQWYLDQLQAKIKNRWKPAANEKDEVVVQFTITRNGSMEGLKMVRSSGRAVLDRQAMQAVEMSAPFASLPSGFSSQSLEIILTLKPQ